jgi:hypothetical protein
MDRLVYLFMAIVIMPFMVTLTRISDDPANEYIPTYISDPLA